MDFLITASVIKREGSEAYRAEEDQVLDELRAEGVVSAAYRRTDDASVIGIAHGTDLASVEAKLARRQMSNIRSTYALLKVVP